MSPRPAGRDAYGSFTRRLSERALASVRRTPNTVETDDSEPVGPTAIYARVIDGESLWLAFDVEPGPLALRRRATDNERPGRRDSPPLSRLPNDAPADDRYASIRWRLTDLDGNDEATFDLVTEAGVGVRGNPVKVFPMRTATTRDRRWQFELTSKNGVLVLRRSRPTRAVEITKVTVENEQVRLWITPAPEGSRLRLNPHRGGTLMEDPGGSGETETMPELDLHVGYAALGVNDIPSTPGSWYLEIAHGDQTIALIRHHDECAQPGRSTALPTLWSTEDAERTVVRFVYGPDSRVRAIREVADADEGASGASEAGS